MKKGVKRTLIVVPVVLIVLGVVFYVLLNRMVKTSVETVLPRITGTPVELEGVSLSMFSGKGSIRGFIIGNPEGYQTDSAFRLGEVRVDVDIPSLFSDTIVIEEIAIRGAQITYEMSGLTDSNIAQIKKNVEAFGGPKEAEPGAEPEEEEKAPGEMPKVEIKKFTMEDCTVSLSATLLKGKKATAPMPPVHLENIGSGGKPIGEVAGEIFDPVHGAVGEAVEVAKKQAGKVLETGKDVVDDAGKTIQDAGKDVKDTVKDLFK
jgi:uncharacterized protein involved in outer membrane biogenesis